MRILVRVIPGAKIGQIREEPDGSLRVWVRDKPVDGSANTALIKILAGHFKVSKSAISIVRGANSRTKLIEIDK